MLLQLREITLCVFICHLTSRLLISSLLREVITAWSLIHLSTIVTSLSMCNQFARSFVILNFLVLWTVFLVYITVKRLLGIVASFSCIYNCQRLLGIVASLTCIYNCQNDFVIETTNTTSTKSEIIFY